MFQLIFTERPRWRLIDRNYINPMIFHHESSSSLRSLPWSSFCHLRKTRDSPRVKKKEDLCCGSRVNGTSKRDESKTRLTWRTVCVISDEKSEKLKWKKSHFGWLTRRRRRCRPKKKKISPISPIIIMMWWSFQWVERYNLLRTDSKLCMKRSTKELTINGIINRV